MEGYHLNPAKCVAFFTSLVALGCMIGLAVMVSTMHHCPARPPCPTTDSTQQQQPDLFENRIGHQTLKQPSFYGNVIEDTTTSITTSETHSQKKSPITDPKKIMTMDIKPNLNDDFQSSSDTPSMETILEKISQQTPSTNMAETMSPDFQSSSDSEMQTILSNTLQETVPGIVDDEDKTLAVILEHVSQEIPSTDSEESSKIQNFAEKMKKAMEIVPEVMDGDNTLTLNFVREVNDSPKTNKSYTMIVAYYIFENGITEEKVTGDGPTSGDGLFRTNLPDESIIEETTGPILEKDIEKPVGPTEPKYKMDIKEEAVGLGSVDIVDNTLKEHIKTDSSVTEPKYKMDIKEEAVGLGSVDIVDNTLKENNNIDSSPATEPKYKLDIKEEAVGLGSVDVVDNTLKENNNIDSSPATGPKYKLDIKEEAVSLGIVDVDNTLKETTSTALTVVDPSSPAVQSGSTKK
ncbi:hypothetical protein DAPPUDRAFT_117652 [Daphnia pulex]|uniref:Uncharacterized protein n=1 Tax=Daphnia pulex TaxID=6669 RepID=E9HTD3_DAPPU|nr:hypothetical protein DAPPUDRAFT_117652 [Daphnia pulex]|eukprot:EFX65002.1 hypothetical protein DAPPUDRAFT_117652 [Daphnia pulex]